MKKILFILICFLLASATLLKAQTPCNAVTAEAFSLNPQSGPYNYFGVRVTLAQPYGQDVTVIGNIYDEGSPRTDNPYTLTIIAGNLTAETEATFYRTDPTAGAVVTIESVTPCPQVSLLNMTTDLQNFINQKLAEINNEGANICSQINTITYDVTSNGSGTLTYPNWVRFVQIGEAVDSLNGVWDQLYASKMNAIVGYAFSSGAVNGQDNTENRDAVWDIVEESHFVISENKATSCLEQKFNFSSLHTQISNNEDAWLDAGNSQMSLNPALNESLPEEYWSLVGPNRTVNITDPNVANQLLNDTQNSDDKKKDLLTKIKEIVEIIGAILNGLEQVSNLMKDCAGSTEAKVRKVRDGLYFDNNNRQIGYEMEQKSITFDFNSTDTKIKGKAKLFKKKKNGNFKKDRKNHVGISFCAREWNGCDNIEWPADGNSYMHPTNTALKKVKTYIHQPMALQITMSYHFLSFNFYGLDQYVGSANLLGANGCF